MHLSQLASAFGRCTGSFSLLLLLTCFLELQFCMVLSSLPFLSYPRSHHRPVPNIIHSCTPLPQNCRPLFGVPAFIHGLCYQSFLCVCRNVCEDMTLLLCTVCPLDAVCYVFCLFAAAAANTPDREKGFIVFAQIIAIVCLQGLCSGWNVFVNCAVSSSHSIVLWWLRQSTHRFQEILHKGSLPYPVFRAR